MSDDDTSFFDATQQNKMTTSDTDSFKSPLSTHSTTLADTIIPVSPPPPIVDEDFGGFESTPDADFSSFTISAPPTSHISTLSQDDDWVTPAFTGVTSVNDFGNFNASTSIAAVVQNDDFGNFADVSTSSATVDDDDFGDFGEAAEVSADVHMTATKEGLPVPFFKKENYSDFLSSLSSADFDQSLGSLLESMFPDQSVKDSNTANPLFIPGEDLNTLIPHPSFTQEPWYQVYRKIQLDLQHPAQVLGKFRWRRSNIHKMALIALNIPLNLDEVDLTPLRRARSSSELVQPLERLSFALSEDDADFKIDDNQSLNRPVSVTSRTYSRPGSRLTSREDVMAVNDLLTTGGDLMEMDNLPILDTRAITRLLLLSRQDIETSADLKSLKEELHLRIRNCKRVLVYLEDQKSYMAIEAEKKNSKIQELVHSLSSLKSSPRNAVVSSAASGRPASPLRPFGI